MKGLIITACLVAALASLAVASSTLFDSKLPQFEESHLGYDLHNDFFYFDDEQVKQAYKRSKYHSTKLTLGGQKADLTGREVTKAVNPFVVAQKAGTDSGSLSDRWDVRQDSQGHQYVGLFHGEKKDFVVNKVRAHLLRNLANSVQAHLSLLDFAVKSNPNDVNLESIKRDVIHDVTAVFKDVDTTIRNAMENSDDSSASAAVVITTESFVVVANLGEGAVLGYNSLGERQVLSGSTSGDGFGLRKSKAAPCEPIVRIHSRKVQDEEGDEESLQFVIVESPLVAKSISVEQAIKTVVGQVNQLRSDEKHEQEIYATSATRILQTVTGSVGLFQKFAQRDYSVAIVGLETDYSKIH